VRSRHTPRGPDYNEAGSESDNGGRRNGVVVAVVVALIGLVGTVIGALIGRTPPPPPAGTIIDPVGGALVPLEIKASGRLSNVPADSKVWLTTIDASEIVYPERRIHGNPSGTDGWSQQISLRGRGIDQTFSLSLTQVSDHADQQMQRREHQPLDDELSKLVGRDPLYQISARLDGCKHPRIGQGTRSDGTAQIDIASDSAVGPKIRDLEGSYRPAAGSRAKLWILVYDQVTDRFYPQTHRDPDFRGDLSAERHSNSEFLSAARFPDRGDKFDLVAVLADPAASEMLSNTVRHSWRTEGPAGLAFAELPAGLEEKDCVRVRRNGP